MFNIDYEKIIGWLIAPFLRKARIKAYFLAMFKPLRQLKDEFIAYREKTRSDLRYTCQVCQIERLVNNFLGLAYALPTREADITAVAIAYVENTANLLDKNYIYRDADAADDPVIFRDADAAADLIIYRDEDYANEYDFIIFIPAATAYVEEEIRALVKPYVKAGIRFKIETY